MAKEGANGSFLFIEHPDEEKFLVQRMGPNYPDRGKLFWPGGRENPGERPQESAAREAGQETGLIVRPDKITWFGVAAQSPRGQVFLSYTKGYGGTLKKEATREIAEWMFMSTSEILAAKDKFHRPAMYMFILFMRWRRGLESTPCSGRISRAIEWPVIGNEKPWVLSTKSS